MAPLPVIFRLTAQSLTLDYSHLQSREGEELLSTSLGFLADRYCSP